MFTEYFCDMPYSVFRFVLLLTLGLASCTTDFEVLAPYQEIKTAYCVLDGADSVHYLRVGKGFQNPTADARAIASAHPDSFTFGQQEVEASLFAMENDVEVHLGTFYPVNIEKDKDGDFPNPNNWTFRLDKKLNKETRMFKIKILSKRTGIESVGLTKVATPFTFVLPNELKSFRSPPDTLNFSYIDNKFRVRAIEEKNPHNRHVKFNYYTYVTEFYRNPVNGELSRIKAIPMTSIGFATNLNVSQPFQPVNFELDYNKYLYNFRLQMPIQDDENVLYRRFAVRGDLEIVSTTQELLDYFDSNSAYSELTQSVATHSNISHALGVFGHIHKKKFSVPMSKESRMRIVKDLSEYRIRL